MAISILNYLSSLAAQYQHSIIGQNLQKAPFQLSLGSRINSGANDSTAGFFGCSVPAPGRNSQPA